MTKKFIGIILLCVFLYLPGCARGTAPVESYVRETANLSLLQTIAVLPFQGNGAGRVRELAMTQLLANNIYDVVDKGLVDRFLQQEGITAATPLDTFTLRRLGESLDVKAVLLGSVEDVESSRGSSSYPEITMTLRIVECETGKVLWQASGMGSGYSMSDRLFGLSPKDKFQVTMDLLYDLMDTMR